ncbi:acyl-CoA dehydrogenase family protein [Tsukamurella sp. PLM1]|uniref:acyl-CoA dehydrogenase family protein n=1 Tax=Tsukamurella sp. PLM1 TaxID=2929795 RepID=UPI00204C8C71|nr:acyl-CoA dehydrogenase family protein [Tsukamurella sp. PLM1]BDH56540.1 hypothetical protein MTP03_14790 [Tsukamurella sp. PLM1]
MTSISPELEEFLQVVRRVAAASGGSGDGLASEQSSLRNTGLLDLGRDTADEPDALYWLAHTVRTAAELDPSLAFVLASRYVADRTFGGEAVDPAFALAVSCSRPVVATAFAPDRIVILDVEKAALRAVPWAALSPDEEERTGLRRASLVSISMPDSAVTLTGSVTDAAYHWDLLTSAALAGIARRALAETQSYVLERHQFGVPIGSFAGLRAMVADMDLTVSGVEAALDCALLNDGAINNLAATAGRAAVDVCVDAIQAHGGYGYIDEYPLAGLLRDAMGIQARAGGRRLHAARVAERGLGPRKGRSS